MKIIIDNREQKPFFQTFFKTDGQVRTSFGTMDAGDYTIEGLEDFIAIERKASSGELYNNLAKKTMKDRFHREMGKLDTIQRAYIVCEFPESDLHIFPKNSGIPKSKQRYIKMSAKYFRKLIHEIKEGYNVEFVFCDNREHAEDVAYSLLKDAWNDYPDLP